MTASELSTLPDEALRAALTACCGASHWVEATLATRPWADAATLLDAAERAWQGLTRAQLAEAVAHHPRLGESRAAATVSAQASAWSAGEQAGTRDADAETRAALAQGNRDYEARFGHTFILCASGRSAAEMLTALRARMTNDPATELDVTAAELWAITRLRLEKLLAGA
jgi:2-oxo-4-hydroxy-4-carboxy-5-ureidoimidazoline decarboxylase